MLAGRLERARQAQRLEAVGASSATSAVNAIRAVTVIAAARTVSAVRAAKVFTVAWTVRASRYRDGVVVGQFQTHAPPGDRAGLVQHDRVQGAAGLQHLGSLDDDTEPGRAPRAHQQGGRRGQTQRARAGDDEHGDGRRQGLLRRIAEPQPYSESHGRHDEHGRDEHARDAVGQALHRGLAGLGGRDHRPDAGQGRARPDGGGPHQQRPECVHAAAGDGVADPDLDGHRLAGEHGGVHGGAALDDHPVGGDLLPGTHGQQVARLEGVDRHALLGAGGVGAGGAVVVQDIDRGRGARRRGQTHPSGFLGAQFEQSAQGIAGTVAGARLGVASGQEEGGDPGGRLEVHVRRMSLVALISLISRQELHGHACADLPGAAPDERPQAPADGGDNAERHERVHGESAVAQAAGRGPVEGPGAPGRHRQRHEGDGPLPTRQLEGRDHGDRHDRDGQDEAVDEAKAQVGGPGELRVPDARGCRGCGLEGGGGRGVLGVLGASGAQSERGSGRLGAGWALRAVGAVGQWRGGAIGDGWDCRVCGCGFCSRACCGLVELVRCGLPD